MSWREGRARALVSKTAAPTVNDDLDHGFYVSDIWLDETNDNAYICLDHTPGAAVWELIDHTSSSDPHTMYLLNTGDEASGDYNFDSGTFKVDSVNHRIKVGRSADTSLAQTLDIAGNLEFDSVTPPIISGMSAALAGGGAGNVNDGEHYYNVCFENADGVCTSADEANTVSVTVVDQGADGKVSLTGIPTSPDPRVTKRRLYRSSAGGGQYNVYYLATIEDNTTTTYEDNIADGSLDTADSIYRKANRTAGEFNLEGVPFLRVTNVYHTALGLGALQALTRGNSNVAIGGDALYSLTTANSNVALGYKAGYHLTSGGTNVAIGPDSLKNCTSGGQNIAIGLDALGAGSANGQNYNVGLGPGTLYGLATGDTYNVAVGNYAGLYFQGIGNTILGGSCGKLSSLTDVGNYNILLGYATGDNAAAGADNNILIGNNLQFVTPNGDNFLSLGNLIFGTGLSSGSTVATGKVGINTKAPDRVLELNVGEATDGIRITYNDSDGSATTYVDLLIDSGGDLTVTCPSGKTVVLGQPVYDDIFLPITNVKLGATAPTWTAFQGNLSQYTFAINDFVEGSFEIPHDYKEGTDLDIHIHIATNGAEASKEVRYSFEYWIANMGAASTSTTTVTGNDYTLTNADGHHEYVDIGDISGTGLQIGAIVCFLLKRVALADGDNPTSDPFVISMGCHYQIDTMGSRTETSK